MVLTKKECEIVKIYLWKPCFIFMCQVAKLNKWYWSHFVISFFLPISWLPWPASSPGERRIAKNIGKPIFLLLGNVFSYFELC